MAHHYICIVSSWWCAVLQILSVILMVLTCLCENKGMCLSMLHSENIQTSCCSHFLKSLKFIFFPSGLVLGSNSHHGFTTVENLVADSLSLSPLVQASFMCLHERRVSCRFAINPVLVKFSPIFPSAAQYSSCLPHICGWVHSRY